MCGDFCESVLTGAWWVGVLSTLTYVALEVMGVVFHVDVQTCAGVMFYVCWGIGVCVGVFLWFFCVFIESVAACLLGSVRCGCLF